MSKLYTLYSQIFAKKVMFNFHKRIFLLSLRGMGLLNSENEFISGENHLQKILKKENIKIIFDVGANAGQFVGQLLKNFPNSIIFAFEPHPVSFNKLNLLNREGLKKFNLGLGKENTVLKLYDYSDNQGSQHASLSKNVIKNIHNGIPKEILVEIVTLDDFCEKHYIDTIDFLKIDIEGFELDVLIGAKQLIQNNRIKVIQFEFNSTNLISKTCIKDFENILINYNLYRLLPTGLIQISSLHLIFKEIFLFQNIVAFHKNLTHHNFS
jgi:FkbM family methyltransferase